MSIYFAINVLSSLLRIVLTRNEIQRFAVFRLNPASQKKRYQRSSFYCRKCAACDCSSRILSSKGLNYSDSGFLKHNGVYICYDLNEIIDSEYLFGINYSEDAGVIEQDESLAVVLSEHSPEKKDNIEEISGALIPEEISKNEETSHPCKTEALKENPSQCEVDSNEALNGFFLVKNSRNSIIEETLLRKNSASVTKIDNLSEHIEIFNEDENGKEEPVFNEKELNFEINEAPGKFEKFKNSTVECVETTYQDETVESPEENKESEEKENVTQLEISISTQKNEIFGQKSDENAIDKNVISAPSTERYQTRPEKVESGHFRALLRLLYGNENDEFFDDNDLNSECNFWDFWDFW